jgi:hypothetical protein
MPAKGRNKGKGKGDRPSEDQAAAKKGDAAVPKPAKVKATGKGAKKPIVMEEGTSGPLAAPAAVPEATGKAAKKLIVTIATPAAVPEATTGKAATKPIVTEAPAAAPEATWKAAKKTIVTKKGTSGPITAPAAAPGATGKTPKKGLLTKGTSATVTRSMTPKKVVDGEPPRKVLKLSAGALAADRVIKRVSLEAARTRRRPTKQQLSFHDAKIAAAKASEELSAEKEMEAMQDTDTDEIGRASCRERV